MEGHALRFAPFRLVVFLGDGDLLWGLRSVARAGLDESEGARGNDISIC